MTPEEMLAYEAVRERLLQQAVAAADRVLLDGCRGNPEVLMLLTGEVARVFMEKLSIMLRAEVYKKEMLCEVPPQALKHYFAQAPEKP